MEDYIEARMDAASCKDNLKIAKVFEAVAGQIAAAPLSWCDVMHSQDLIPPIFCRDVIGGWDLGTMHLTLVHVPLYDCNEFAREAPAYPTNVSSI